ncbi:hypothetical protein MP228_009277 [Amoeboaphelidium protococcarum]|nr:hypothetical protein MP228_009277 [Amoeboaphelidium protococcarum]
MTKYSAQLQDIENVKLRFVDPATNQAAEQEVSAASLYNDHPVFFVVVRRTGCVACRELVNEIMVNSAEISKLYNVKFVAVIKEIIQEDLAGYREYFNGDVYLDTELGMFKALTGGKLVKHSLFSQMLRGQMWKGVKRALDNGIKNGSLSGDSTVFGGFILAAKEGVFYQHNQELGVLPSMKEVFEALSNLPQQYKRSEASPDHSGVVLNDNKRMVCTDEVCVRT